MPGSLETFQNQSIRLIVHCSAGGQPLRLRIANTYGEGPLIIGSVHVALRATGAAIDPRSDRQVSFAGRRTLTIAARSESVSDPVALAVPALADLAVSLYLPRPTPARTSHLLALQTGYVAAAAGDRTAQVAFRVGRTITSWPFLTGVEVQSPQASGTIVVFGDSTVDGDGSTANVNHRWPDLLAKALDGDGTPGGFGVVNAGLIGNRLLRDSPHSPDSEFGDALGQSGLSRFAHDALWPTTTSVVIVRLGLNDLGLPGVLAPLTETVTAEELVAGYRRLIAQARQQGVRILGTTIGPFENASYGNGYFTAQKEAVRQQVNAWLRSAGEFDGIIDLDAVLRDPEHPARLLAAFDSGDHLHPNDAGNLASAAAVPRWLITASQRTAH